MPPPFETLLDLIVARANSRESAELSLAQEAVECLHIAAESMVQRCRHLPLASLRDAEQLLHTARGEGERALAEDVNARLERAQHVRLMKMIGRGDDHRVELIELEQVLDIGEDVGNSESIGERARFGAVVVA